MSNTSLHIDPLTKSVVHRQPVRNQARTSGPLTFAAVACDACCRDGSMALYVIDRVWTSFLLALYAFPSETVSLRRPLPPTVRALSRLGSLSPTLGAPYLRQQHHDLNGRCQSGPVAFPQFL